MFDFVRVQVGAVVSILLPMPVVVFDPTKSWGNIFLVVVIPSVVHTIIGNVIEPRHVCVLMCVCVCVSKCLCVLACVRACTYQ